MSPSIEVCAKIMVSIWNRGEAGLAAQHLPTEKHFDAVPHRATNALLMSTWPLRFVSSRPSESDGRKARLR